MQYCTKCRQLNEDKITVCSNCKRTRTLRPVKDNDSVYLMTCHKFEAEEIASVFEENGVKHTVEKYSLGVIQSPFDSRNMKDDQNIYVDYSDIEAANAVLQKYDEGKEEETVPDDMPRGKRIALDIIGIVLFMIIVSLVVFASDYVANGLRNFFNRAEIGMIKELCSWLII